MDWSKILNTIGLSTNLSKQIINMDKDNQDKIINLVDHYMGLVSQNNKKLEEKNNKLKKNIMKYNENLTRNKELRQIENIINEI